VKLPEEVTDDQAILLSDIFPTGYQAAHMAGIRQGDVVCVFGCGPVGQFAIWNAKHLGAGRVLAVDAVPDRLELARAQGAEVVNFEEENTVDLIAEVTRGVGPGPRHRRGRHRREPTARGRRPGVRGGDRGARARARARRAAPAAGLRAVLRARVGGRGGGEGGDDLPSGSTRRPRRASRSATRS
jgi:threonine dehydrogenase-like Zn-dependent dehydrogenase